ncbi:FUSC family protein [Aliirhizobium smilacinae]|uniref:FUSC family protein n=1 Tax=Aliirhizobium smilacinae TaxID=1395944 RepID=A0A5C4XR13_9HYPH|nr:FUSC family protein [Rhizobium smilacinae]TNM65004.1 FUSC family protein [Rhizobium smilacinae]
MPTFRAPRTAWALAATFVDRLLAHDPALSRVKMGARVTLTILASILTLITIHLTFIPLPPISYALAIVLSIEGGVAVKDKTPADQLTTRMMGCAASLFCITLAATLEGYRLVADLTFLFVIFAASLARVFGPRGFAVGMFAFISYFIGAYLKPTLAELPLAALGPLFAVAFGHLIRRYLFVDDWRRDLVKSLRAIQRRVSNILSRLAQLSRSEALTDKDRLELRQMEEQLKDVVLMAEGLLPRNADGSMPTGDGPVTAVSMAIFDLHLAAESVIVQSLGALAPALLFDAVLRGDAASAKKIAEDPDTAGGDERTKQSVHALLWLHRASLALSEAANDRSFLQLMAFGGLPQAGMSIKPDFSWNNPLVRAAVQITIASGIAMIFGLLLSRERWFWAVLTAFLVFNNTRSRGDAALRAIQRSVGTLVGVAIGLGLATLLSGNMTATVMLAAACVFLAFYFLQVSYALLSFFVTIVLCLVYGLIGQLTYEVLLLRLEETVIGSVAGMFVAFVIFPSSTRSTVELALARWYDALGQVLDGVSGGESRYRLIELSNRLDEAYRDLTVAARPLGSAWSLVTRLGPIRQTLAVFLASSYWARILARDFSNTENRDDPKIRRAIDDARLALGKAAARGAECFSSKTPRHATAGANLAAPGEGVAHGADMVANLLNRLYPPAADKQKSQ